MRPTLAERTPFFVLTGGLALMFLFPLIWSAIASVSGQPGTAQASGFGFGNYVTLLKYGSGLGTYLGNSVIVSVLTVVVTLAVSVFGGYAFARFTFPGRNALFLLTLGILMVPYATLLIPLYVLLHNIGLQNSLLGLALVLAMFQLPFAIFMMRISFEACPARSRSRRSSTAPDRSGSSGGSCCRPRDRGSSRSRCSRSSPPGTTSSPR
jgi:multiple sugar transport system permease protein